MPQSPGNQAIWVSLPWKYPRPSCLYSATSCGVWYDAVRGQIIVNHSWKGISDVAYLFWVEYWCLLNTLRWIMLCNFYWRSLLSHWVGRREKIIYIWADLLKFFYPRNAPLRFNLKSCPLSVTHVSTFIRRYCLPKHKFRISEDRHTGSRNSVNLGVDLWTWNCLFALNFSSSSVSGGWRCDGPSRSSNRHRYVSRVYCVYVYQFYV